MLIVRHNSSVVKKADFPPHFDLKLGYIYCKIILPNCSNDFFGVRSEYAARGTGRHGYGLRFCSLRCFTKLFRRSIRRMKKREERKNGENIEQG